MGITQILIAFGIFCGMGLIVGAILAFIPGAELQAREKIRVFKEDDKAESSPMVAFVKCSGGGNVARRYTYEGAADCAAAEVLSGGPVKCRYACLGIGSCVSACKFDAIAVKDGLAEVDAEKCTGCGKCIDVCPRGVIELVPAAAQLKVRCSSFDQGSKLRKNCDMGCIGCMLCVKTCKYDAVKVNDNLAVIDYEKCTGCGECADVCPRGIITSEKKTEESPAEEAFDEKEYFELEGIEDEK